MNSKDGSNLGIKLIALEMSVSNRNVKMKSNNKNEIKRLPITVKILQQNNLKTDSEMSYAKSFEQT